MVRNTKQRTHRVDADYPPNWTNISAAVKHHAGNRCIRCGHPNETPWKGIPGLEPSMCDDLCSHPDNGKQRVLTVHHLDMDKSNCNWWNLAALCQGCHLHIQAKVDFEQYWMLEHSAWLRPFVLGYDLHQKTGMSVVNVGLQPYDVYIGRAHRRHGDGKTSIWANQYIIGKDGDRSEVLQKYSVWLDFVVVAYPDKYKIVDFLGVRAGCFCKPLGCHGDVIGAKLLEMSMVIRK